jgi:hypothetical protein
MLDTLFLDCYAILPVNRVRYIKKVSIYLYENCYVTLETLELAIT